jgi:hypothetical protein
VRFPREYAAPLTRASIVAALVPAAPDARLDHRVHCIGFSDFVGCQRPPPAHLRGETPATPLPPAPERLRPSGHCSDQHPWTSSALSLIPLPGCLPLGHYLECGERFIPESLQPLPQRLNAPCVDGVDPSRTLGMNSHQSCCLEDLQVLRDCGATHLHPFGDLAYGSCAAAQAIQHHPPGRVSQGIEDSLFVSFHLQ